MAVHLTANNADANTRHMKLNTDAERLITQLLTLAGIPTDALQPDQEAGHVPADQAKAWAAAITSNRDTIQIDGEGADRTLTLAASGNLAGHPETAAWMARLAAFAAASEGFTTS